MVCHKLVRTQPSMVGYQMHKIDKYSGEIVKTYIPITAQPIDGVMYDGKYFHFLVLLEQKKQLGPQ